MLIMLPSVYSGEHGESMYISQVLFAVLFKNHHCRCPFQNSSTPSLLLQALRSLRLALVRNLCKLRLGNYDFRVQTWALQASIYFRHMAKPESEHGVVNGSDKCSFENFAIFCTSFKTQLRASSSSEKPAFGFTFPNIDESDRHLKDSKGDGLWYLSNGSIAWQLYIKLKWGWLRRRDGRKQILGKQIAVLSKKDLLLQDLCIPCPSRQRCLHIMIIHCCSCF